MLSNDNGTQEQELSDELNAVDTAKNMVEVGKLLIDVCEAVESIISQDGDINKKREILEQTEKICKDTFPLDQEHASKKQYLQEIFCDLLLGQPNDEPHDGEQ